MEKPIRLGIVFGGRSGEHEVSLVSARSVLNTLDPDKYQITQIGITIDGDWLVGENVLEHSERNLAETIFRRLTLFVVLLTKVVLLER